MALAVIKQSFSNFYLHKKPIAIIVNTPRNLRQFKNINRYMTKRVCEIPRLNEILDATTGGHGKVVFSRLNACLYLYLNFLQFHTRLSYHFFHKFQTCTKFKT